MSRDASPLRRHLTADAVAGVITLVAGVWLTVVAYGIEPSAFGNAVLQPRDLPLVCGVGLTLAGAALLVQGLRQARREPEGSVEREHRPAESKRRLGVLAALLLGYLLAFIPLGYIVATASFLLVGSVYFSPGKLRRNILFAVLLSVGVYILFTRVLGIVLPQGILEPIL